MRRITCSRPAASRPAQRRKPPRARWRNAWDFTRWPSTSPAAASPTSLTYTELLGQLADTQHGDTFQQLVDDLFMQVPTDHTNDIAATFTRSLQHLDDKALTLLRIAATLAPAPLPEQLLTAVSASLYQEPEQAVRGANRVALSAAQRRSLIRQTGTEPPSWFVHALASRTLTLQPDTADLKPALRTAAVTGTAHFMRPVYTPGRLDLAGIAPHARLLVEALDTVHSLALLDAVARYDFESGQPVSAAHSYQRLTEAWATSSGPDHPDTLTSRDNLASAYYAAGDLGRAIPLHEQTLADRVRVLGEDHPDTLVSRNNLAGAYQAAGDLGRAIPLFEQTLADRVWVLGDDHPDTLVSRNNLAGAYQTAGGLDRAIPLFEQTLADRVRVLGDDHPVTLPCRNSLATAYHAAGDLGRAIPLFEQIVDDCVRVLGEDHPGTLACRGNLATAYHAAGDLGRAIALFEQILVDCVRVLGEDHPATLACRNNLATAHRAAEAVKQPSTATTATAPDQQRPPGAH
ncbi:tetratricopeptide repeat protein [Streptomyces sp. NPDC088253]|uniref:tetratricopeptide repeat protein n=1 Tax=Streptomyces sp. NPDC088253 TaxID=3365846 RepID=UPI0037FE0AAD